MLEDGASTGSAMPDTSGHLAGTGYAEPADQSGGSAAEDREALLRPQVLIAIAMVVGLMLRILQYGANRSLWLDELLVVPGIVRPSFLDLLSPASWSHLPPGFLLLEKLAVSALGLNEFALRLLPFLAGIAALFLSIRLADRFVTSTAVPIAVALFALSPFLVYYSSELKPYSTDVLASMLLLLLALDLSERGVTARRAAVFGGAAMVAAGFSMTSVFVSVGCALALVVDSWRARNREGMFSLAAVFAGWAVVFGIPYLLFVHGSTSNEYAREFWRSGFMPMPPRSLEELVWLPRMTFQLFRDPLGVFSDEQSASGIWAASAGLLAFVLGAVWMVRQRSARIRILLFPVLVTLVASALMLYPFGGSRAAAGRVVLFLAPMFFLVMAQGAAWVWERCTGESRIVALGFLGFLLVPALVWGAVGVPALRTEVKPLLSYLEEQAQPGDLLYVHYDVRHAFEHYAPDYRLTGVRYLPGVCSRGDARGYVDALSGLRGAPRVWVLFANGQGAGLFDEKAIMVDYLEHVGDRLDDQVTVGASLYLYDLRQDAGNAEPYRAQLPVAPLGIADDCALWN